MARNSFLNLKIKTTVLTFQKYSVYHLESVITVVFSKSILILKFFYTTECYLIGGIKSACPTLKFPFFKLFARIISVYLLPLPR